MKTFILTSGNPLVKGQTSMPVKAASAVDAVIKVFGGCSWVNGNRYCVGKLFGTVEETK